MRSGVRPARAPRAQVAVRSSPFANRSESPDSQVFLAIETPSNSVASLANFNNVGVPLRDPSTNQPNFWVSSADASEHSFYFCLNAQTTGRLFISIGQGIPDLPGPLVTDTFRWGLVELGPPGSADVDYSNVNNFDFPLNLATYSSPATGAAIERATVTVTRAVGIGTIVNDG